MTTYTTNCMMARLDNSRNLLWQKSYGGSRDDIVYSVIQTSDGNFVMCGATASSDGDVHGVHLSADGSASLDCWLVKTDGAGNILSQKCLGGSSTEYARSTIETSDGGFLMTGNTTSTDGDVSGYHLPQETPLYNHYYDDWVVKLDAKFNIERQRCLGGSDNEIMAEAKQTGDGNYIIAGFSRSSDGDITDSHGGGDVWLVKLDTTLNIKWQKTYGGSENDIAQSVYITNDGGYLIAATSFSDDADVTPEPSYHKFQSDYWILQTDSAGVLQWNRSLGGNDAETAANAEQLPDNSYIIAGTTSSYNNGDVTGNHSQSSDYWIVKLSPTSGVLPVSFLSFYGNINGSENILHWAIENNNSGGSFEIQRSVDGRTYVPVGEISFHSENRFSFTDQNVPNQCYYRIKQTDRAGFSKYSSIVYLNRAATMMVSLVGYPNPVQDVLQVKIVSPATQKFMLNIVNLNGVTLFSNDVTVEKGQTTIPVEVAHFASGNYFIKLTGKTDSKSYVQKFLKK